jgi:hypothetical protein
MIPDFMFNMISFVKVSYTSIFGSKIQKLVVEITDTYYYQLSLGLVHEEAISRIMNDEYLGDKKKIDDCKYFVYSRKQSIDSIFDMKYGKRGRFMSNLFKLIQKIYLDTKLDDTRMSYDEELNNSMLEINKIFNRVVLYKFAKYDS